MKAPVTHRQRPIPALLLASLVPGRAGAADSAVVASGLNNPRGIDVGANGRSWSRQAGTGRVRRSSCERCRPYVTTACRPVTSDEGEVDRPGQRRGPATATPSPHRRGPPRGRRALRHAAAHLRAPPRGRGHRGYQATDPDPVRQDGNSTESNPYGLAAMRRAGRRRPMPPTTTSCWWCATGRIRTAGHGSRCTWSSTLAPPGLPGAPDDRRPRPCRPPWRIGTRTATATSVTLTGFPFTPGASRIWRLAPWARNAVCDRGHQRRLLALRATASRPSPAWTSGLTAACTSSRSRRPACGRLFPAAIRRAR